MSLCPNNFEIVSRSAPACASSDAYLCRSSWNVFGRLTAAFGYDDEAELRALEQQWPELLAFGAEGSRWDGSDYVGQATWSTLASLLSEFAV